MTWLQVRIFYLAVVDLDLLSKFGVKWIGVVYFETVTRMDAGVEPTGRIHGVF